ncbi:MAG: hypothetical protein Q8R83_09550 [Legionellaceae bacterium]|nr:hypothetical protein [Legionellaceae bacterium]
MFKTPIQETKSPSSASDTNAALIERRPRIFHVKEVRKTMTELADIKKAHSAEAFGADDVDYLGENEFGRYDSNNQRIGHAVISKNEAGELIAQSYPLPAGNLAVTPSIYPLTEIEAIERNGERRYQAKDHDGRRYYSKRSLHGLINQNDAIEIAFFSEEEDSDQEPEWGNNHVPDLFLDSVTQPEMPKKIKGGRPMMIDPKDVRFRDAHHSRGKDQNTVMGMASEEKNTPIKAAAPVKGRKAAAKKTNTPEKLIQRKKASLSAQKVYETFYNTYKHNLTPEMAEVLQRAFNAELHSEPENQYRPEWLHTYAYSLTPEDVDPQREDNLGAAAKWANTEMMLLERIAKWFAVNLSHIEIQILSAFQMLRDTEIIDSIHYELSLKLLNNHIKYMLDINALRQTPVFRKASDLAQATGITYAILHNHIPTSSVEKSRKDLQKRKSLTANIKVFHLILIPILKPLF